MNADTSAFFEWNACVSDGTADTPWRCTYVILSESEVFINDVYAFVRYVT